MTRDLTTQKGRQSAFDDLDSEFTKALQELGITLSKGMYAEVDSDEICFTISKYSFSIYPRYEQIQLRNSFAFSPVENWQIVAFMEICIQFSSKWNDVIDLCKKYCGLYSDLKVEILKINQK